MNSKNVCLKNCTHQSYFGYFNISKKKSKVYLFEDHSDYTNLVLVFMWSYTSSIDGYKQISTDAIRCQTYRIVSWHDLCIRLVSIYLYIYDINNINSVM